MLPCKTIDNFNPMTQFLDRITEEQQNASAVMGLAGPNEDIDKLLECDRLMAEGSISYTEKNNCIILANEYKQKCDSDLAIENVLPCKDVDGYNPMTSFLNRTTAELQSENAEINAQIDNHEFFEERDQIYKCGDCTVIMRGTEFIVYEHPDGKRTIAIDSPIIDNDLFGREMLRYTICHVGDEEPLAFFQCDE